MIYYAQSLPPSKNPQCILRPIFDESQDKEQGKTREEEVVVVFETSKEMADLFLEAQRITNEVMIELQRYFEEGQKASASGPQKAIVRHAEMIERCGDLTRDFYERGANTYAMEGVRETFEQYGKEFPDYLREVMLHFAQSLLPKKSVKQVRSRRVSNNALVF